MTASQRNHATSDNSVSNRDQDGTENVAPQRDPRLRSVAQYLDTRNGAVTAIEIASKADWTRWETNTHIDRIRDTNLVQLLDNLQETVLLLTTDEERFTHGSGL